MDIGGLVGARLGVDVAHFSLPGFYCSGSMANGCYGG